MNQLDMFAPPAQVPTKRTRRERVAAVEAKRPRRRTIEERCADFDAAHPEVDAEIRRLAIEAFQQGRRRIGIGLLVEVARWNLETSARDGQGYKLNNDYRRSWSRRLIAELPALASMFELRAVRTK